MNLFFFFSLLRKEFPNTISSLLQQCFVPLLAQIFGFLFAVVSDDEVLDSEDEKMIGCLGFVAASSAMDHGSTSSSKNQTSNDKIKMSNVCPQSDITKVTPGNYFFTCPTKTSFKLSILTIMLHTLLIFCIYLHYFSDVDNALLLVFLF